MLNMPMSQQHCSQAQLFCRSDYELTCLLARVCYSIYCLLPVHNLHIVHIVHWPSEADECSDEMLMYTDHLVSVVNHTSV